MFKCKSSPSFLEKINKYNYDKYNYENFKQTIKALFPSFTISNKDELADVLDFLAFEDDFPFFYITKQKTFKFILIY